MKIINPKEIKINDLPLIVLSDDRRGFIGWIIKQHSKGSYNHVMMMTRPGYLASQGFLTYAEIPVEKMMKPGIMLKFWRYNPIKHNEKIDINIAIANDLKKNWFKRSYDFLGIVGQFTGLRWIQSPWKFYCSEIVAKYLRLIPELKDKIPVHPSPADLNKLFHTIPGFVEYGCYLED